MDPLQTPQPQQPLQQQTQGMYQPIGVPAGIPTQSSGMSHAIIGIVCAIISLLFIPILFGAIGIILGSSAERKGHKTLGITTIILSAVCMVIGMLLGIYFHLHPELLKPRSATTGAVIEAYFK